MPQLLGPGAFGSDEPSTALPAVAIASPLAGAEVSGVLVVEGSASYANGNVSRVVVAVDDGGFALATGTTSWRFLVNTTSFADGEHVVRARAYADDASASEEAAVVFTVLNGPAPNAPPTVTIAAPAPDDVVVGALSVRGTAADTDGVVSRVDVSVDGGPFVRAAGTDRWEFGVDSLALANGVHGIAARAYDGSAYSEVARVEFVVLNLPDLVVDSIRVHGTATTRTIEVVVSNVGTRPAPLVDVAIRYEYGGERHLIDTPATTEPIAAGGNALLTASWDTTGKIGRFPISATVDPADLVLEADEKKNTRSGSTIIVADGPPVDLRDPV